MFKNGQTIIFGFKRYFSVSVLKPLETFSTKKSPNTSLDVTFTNIDKNFKLILDVRSPGEFKIDHLPGAVNIPILDNEERSEVGTIYVKDNPLQARLIGSSIIMKNLSKFIQPGGILFTALHERIKDNNDRIIVYCARGGQRSRSVAIVLSEICFTNQPVNILDGGYRAYRKRIVEDIEKLPNEISFVGICGLTGSAKTKILHCLRASGELVLDLEDLAKHKGSVFGRFMDYDKINEKVVMIQTSQKEFDSKLWVELTNFCKLSSVRRCKNNRPIVWLECESRNIGNVQIGNCLWNQMQNSKRVIIEASIEERVKHILADYSYLTDSKYLETTKDMIQWLSLVSSQTLIDKWNLLADSGEFGRLVESLLKNHYDPIYTKNRKPFISCTDTDRVAKVTVESLDRTFIEKEVCSKLINLSKSWLE